MTAVALRGATVRFGERVALHGVDVRLEPGEHVAILGSSGAGKTTLLRLLNGSLAPAAGSVELLGHDPARLRARARRRVQRRIGTVHQGLHLVGPLRVVHNVNAGRLGYWPLWRAVASLVSPRAAPEATAALARVGLEGRERERTDQLSGGEQQRVAIARLLMQRPAVVLADEPVANLDPPRARRVLDLVLGVQDAAVVVTLHDVAVALERFDRVIGLRDGRVRFDAPAERVTAAMIDDLYVARRTA